MTKVRFNLRFSIAVRKSLATQIIKAAWGGSGAFTLLGALIGSGWVILAMVFWWLLCQTIAHMLLAAEEGGSS